MGHILLFDLLDGYFLASLKVNGHLDQSKLSFSERFLKFIVIKDITVVHDLLESINPLFLLLSAVKVEDVNLVWGDADSDRVVLHLRLGAGLGLRVCLSSLNKA